MLDVNEATFPTPSAKRPVAIPAFHGIPQNDSKELSRKTTDWAAKPAKVQEHDRAWSMEWYIISGEYEGLNLVQPLDGWYVVVQVLTVGPSFQPLRGRMQALTENGPSEEMIPKISSHRDTFCNFKSAIVGSDTVPRV
jgi:hypothetical protein